MKQETKEKNRQAGRKNLIEAVKYLKETGKSIKYFNLPETHYLMMSMAYDYLWMHPEAPLKSWKERENEASEILRDIYAGRFLEATNNSEKEKAKETWIYWHISKEALKEKIKEIAKTLIVEQYIKKLVDEKKCIDDL
jgi:hypothetical protein